ncbi:hypothetical protein [Paenibacillus lemnae]|uniref:Uncharacterized protein n=1 Tax=Paenibacillus lemnae TaxID=1330551 RepID=A0A848M7J3_PAELE|nr:hypothetical protein [Paenibacillus lemnae]NMO96967.1 hypothetical protein [Paenibacillus lemnae]
MNVHGLLKSVILPGLLSFTLCLGLVLTYPTDGASEPFSAAVFNPESRGILNEANIVDEMSRLPIHKDLKRVDLRRGVLSVDVRIVDVAGSPNVVHRQLTEMLSFSFEKMVNVEQLYLRFMAEDAWTGQQHLLLAAAMHRREWSPELQRDAAELAPGQFSEEMVRRLHLTLTNLWQRQFRDAVQG